MKEREHDHENKPRSDESESYTGSTNRELLESLKRNYAKLGTRMFCVVRRQYTVLKAVDRACVTEPLLVAADVIKQTYGQILADLDDKFEAFLQDVPEDAPADIRQVGERLAGQVRGAIDSRRAERDESFKWRVTIHKANMDESRLFECIAECLLDPDDIRKQLVELVAVSSRD